MSEPTDTSSDDGGGERGISVRRLAPARGTTSRQIIRAVRAALGDHPARAISVAVVDEPSMASLHERYLGDPHPTDVMAFDLRDDPEDAEIEGEVVVSVDAAREQAKRLGLELGQELLRYVIHGTLHLTGYDDGTPAARRRMRRAEDRVLAEVNDRSRHSGGRSKQRRTTGGV